MKIQFIFQKTPVLLAAVVLMSCSLFSGGNHIPVISQDVIVTTTTQSNMLNEITGVTTKITVKASDEDSDVLTYRWTASNGAISGNGPSGTWRRELRNNNNELAPGTAAVTVSDGHGGEATYTYHG
jgi:hypothetical protein